jgi:hypothetical protein
MESAPTQLALQSRQSNPSEADQKQKQIFAVQLYPYYKATSLIQEDLKFHC